MKKFYLIENDKRNIEVVILKKSTFKKMKKQNYKIFKDFINALKCLYE